ncbi:hypothetical protein [Megasphaera sp.]|jgi:hypothetical protein|uniref:hypothetical protein n=1 Tax=Megasphaera sp. TaxID=2023260 RepID=UPI003FEE2EF3
MPDMDSVSMMERTFSMQLDFLKAIRGLIAYDKDHSQEPEKTRFLEAFCDTQEKALNMAVLLLNKHKDSLLDEEKAQKEAKRAKDMAKQKEEAQKKAIEDDLKKAETEEGSLFAGLDGDDDEEDC